MLVLGAILQVMLQGAGPVGYFLKSAKSRFAYGAFYS